jgi:uncharacterized membrane protein YidH (DUF202 family)
MKTSMTDIVGILLILFGIITLGYRGFNYQKPEEVLKLGDMRITATTEKHVEIPPIVSGASIVAGVVLIAIGRFAKK